MMMMCVWGECICGVRLFTEEWGLQWDLCRMKALTWESAVGAIGQELPVLLKDE